MIIIINWQFHQFVKNTNKDYYDTWHSFKCSPFKAKWLTMSKKNEKKNHDQKKFMTITTTDFYFLSLLFFPMFQLFCGLFALHFLYTFNSFSSFLFQLTCRIYRTIFCISLKNICICLTQKILASIYLQIRW